MQPEISAQKMAIIKARSEAVFEDGTMFANIVLFDQ
jgi:hypothetical protein